MPTPNENIIAEKELLDPEKIKVDDAKFKELSEKETLVPEETKELGEIKERYGKRMQKKIDKLTYEARTAKEETEREKQERERLEQEVKDLKEKVGTGKKIDIDISTQTVEIAGKKYYTDDALLIMINNKEISEAEAVKYQQNRFKAEVKSEMREESEKEGKERSAKETKAKDADWVNKNYPQFNKNHPDFNPEEPLYKKSVELYTEAYAARPDGLSLAIKRAKEILRISDTNPDLTDELGLEHSETPLKRKGEGEKEVTLDEAEKEWGIRMYCRGDVINPRTQKPYTEQEALVKALEAKKRRLEK